MSPPPYPSHSSPGHTPAALEVLRKRLRTDLPRALAAGLLAVIVLAVGSNLGDLHSPAFHTSPGAAPATRLFCALTGYLVVLGGTLGLLTVPWQHLLVGGAVTGVIAGIAAQQPLSNLFAGLLLLLARPVTVGQTVRVHSGALGGPLDGAVTDISLLYTTRTHGDDVLSIPNAALLNAALRTIPNAVTDSGSAVDSAS